MRLIVAALAATLSITSLALAAGGTVNVHLTGTSSQGQRVSVRVTGPKDTTTGRQRVSFALVWKAYCGNGIVYTGYTNLHSIRVRNDGSYDGHLTYHHALKKQRGQATVLIHVRGQLNAARTRARGIWGGLAKLPGVGDCKSGKVLYGAR